MSDLKVRPSVPRSIGLVAAVAAGQGVPADDEDVEKHLDGIAEHVYFGGRRVTPTDRDFDRAETVVAREIEEFGVEAEALNGLQLEDELAFFTAESVLAALVGGG